MKVSFSYLIRIMSGVRFKKLNKVLSFVHKKTGKSKINIFFDILSCVIRYGAGYNDYILFEYYYMNKKERETYISRVKNKYLISKYNDESYAKFFDEKNLFAEKFKDFLGRKVLDVAKIDLNEFKEFIDGQEYIFAKPYIGESGFGIEKLKVSDFKTPEEMYNYIKNPEKNFGIIEHLIIQHSSTAEIYPYSLNCFRVATLLHEDKVNVLYAVFKMGNNNNFVDNFDNGGLACHYDLDKGEIISYGHSADYKSHKCHPQTGTEFLGKKLPFNEEIKELVTKAAKIVPQVGYVGWDVCLTENGPILIEGNDFPGYDFPQLPDENLPRIGLLPKLKAIGVKF